MIARAIYIVLTCAAIGLTPIAACANDSALAYGGSPRALSEHPTVSMKSEVIRMVVGEKAVTVDCAFVFENHGPACTVRMGFPDQGEGAANPDEEGRYDPPRSTFNSFQSWVDGKPVKTKLIRAAQLGEYWHAKTVAFPANRQVSVRDRYTVDVGNSVAYNFGLHETSYILHTGSSWHGTIGRSEIDVVFKCQGVHAPITLKRITTLPRVPGQSYSTPNYSKETSGNKKLVYYAGPCQPEVSGRTLTFVRTDWRPTEHDDVKLVFEMGKPPK